jgi:hypothetical protein
MFLFAHLMTAYLYDQTSVADLDQQLSPEVFPQGPLRLDEAYVYAYHPRCLAKCSSYSRIMKRLNTAGPTHAQALKLLTWMVCAKRRMYWREVQCAVSIDIDEQTVDWDRKKLSVDSKELGGSLVEMYADDTIALVHHTAKR